MKLGQPTPVPRGHGALRAAGDLGDFAQGESIQFLEHDDLSLRLVQALQRPVENAFKLYCRSRPSASVESNARAKTLEQAGDHPMLISRDTSEGRSSQSRI